MCWFRLDVPTYLSEQGSGLNLPCSGLFLAGCFCQDAVFDFFSSPLFFQASETSPPINCLKNKHSILIL